MRLARGPTQYRTGHGPRRLAPGAASCSARLTAPTVADGVGDRAVGRRQVSPLTDIATSPMPKAYSIMNSPGCGARDRLPPPASVHSVAVSRVSSHPGSGPGTGPAPCQVRSSTGTQFGQGHLVHFGGDVDAGRAPRDAPPATDASRHCRTGRARCPTCGSATAGNATRRSAGRCPSWMQREVQLETRRPGPPAFGVLPGQVGDVLGAGAEAGRADHRAVPACQAAARHLVPVRRIPRQSQQLAASRDRASADPSAGRALPTSARGRTDFIGLRPGRCGTAASTSAPASLPTSTKVATPVTVDAFGQRQVVARGPTAGPVPIDAQKHSPPGSVQLTATTKSLPSATQRTSRPGELPPPSTRSSVAIAARSQPRTPRNAYAGGSSSARCQLGTVRGCRTTPAAGVDAETASRTAGRPSVRTPRRRRVDAADSARGPRRPPSRAADRRPTPARPARSRCPAASVRPPDSHARSAHGRAGLVLPCPASPSFPRVCRRVFPPSRSSRCPLIRNSCRYGRHHRRLRIAARAPIARRASDPSASARPPPVSLRPRTR